MKFYEHRRAAKFYKISKHHRKDYAKYDQRDIKENKGRHAGIPDVAMPAVDIQPHGRPKRAIARRRARIADTGSHADDKDRRRRAKAQLCG